MPNPTGPAPDFHRQLFERALSLPVAEREAFVRQDAGDDEALAAAVLRLLAHASGTTSPAEQKVQSTATAELMERLAEAPKLDVQRYQLEGEVDRGGMGAILKIHDRHLNRRLAMKVLLERESPRDDFEQQLAHQLLGRFLEEAQVTSQLNHPGVVPVHELGLDQDGKVYFTMRLVKGRTASAVFHDAYHGRADWTVTRALEVILRVCDTMAYAHDKGVLHRDLKPQNVMVGRFGEVYVMDWGLAKIVGHEGGRDLRIRPQSGSTMSHIDSARKRDTDSDDGASVVSMDGQKLGTPSYMPPEQARSEALDQRADGYAIGAMLYELLTGRAPYTTPGVRKPAYRILEDVAEGPPKPIPEIARGVPAELVAVVDKAMARDRERRYANVTVLAADLRAFLDQRAVHAYRTGALVELKLWVRRNKPLAASLVAAVLILVLGIAGTTIYAREADRQAEENAKLAISEREARQAADKQAEANARLAREKTALAEEKTALAAAEAAAKGQFDQLSGLVQYERSIETEAALYPAWPGKVAAMDEWLQSTDELLGKEQSIRDTVLSLRQKALPATPEEIEAGIRAHARYPEYERLANRLTSLRRADAIRGGEPLPDVTLSTAQQALDANWLDSLAWDRVAPEAAERKVWGEEALGLAAARAAVAKDRQPAHLDTLAWALLANGHDDEAQRVTAQALAAAPAAERETYEGHRHALVAAVTRAAENLVQAERELADLGDELRQWQFGTQPKEEAAGFLHRALTELLAKMASLKATKAGVRQRRGWAEQIEELTLAHPKARHTWPEVRAAIASNAKYAGQEIPLRDAEVLGLVPIGENPVTHLWEFYELRSAWDGKADPGEVLIPEHAPDGSIAVTGDTGIVFALLPGGTFTMGAQKSDPHGLNFDRDAQQDESPLHEVTLDAFFLARHELTRGQWQRLIGTSPFRWDEGSNYNGDRIAIGPSHPADSMDWDEANRCMDRHGLVLPTEAQLEYGCRAGTTTPWWPGPSDADLQGIANVHDQTSVMRQPQWGTPAPVTDGFTGIAPVGRFGANAFGLFDVHGNVWEWCRDWYGDYEAKVRAGDGYRLEGSSSAFRVYRGGSFDFPAWNARSANRYRNAPSIRNYYLGLRPARLITL